MKIPTDRKPSRGFSRSGEMSNASTYAENAIAYCQRTGRENGNHPVIEKGTENWALWMNYFAHIGHSHASPRSFANMRGRLSVPTETPDEFEPGWKASPAAELHPVASKYTNPEIPEKYLRDTWSEAELSDETILINHLSFLPGRRYHHRPITPSNRTPADAGCAFKPYGYLTPAETAWVQKYGERLRNKTIRQEIDHDQRAREKPAVRKLYQSFSDGIGRKNPGRPEQDARSPDGDKMLAEAWLKKHDGGKDLPPVSYSEAFSEHLSKTLREAAE